MTTKDKLINWLAMQPGAVGLVRLVIDGRVPFDPNVPRRMFDVIKFLRMSGGNLTEWRIKWRHYELDIPTLEEQRVDFNRRLQAAMEKHFG